jgi:hypothetical protein
MRFEVLTSMFLKMKVFWDVTVPLRGVVPDVLKAL